VAILIICPIPAEYSACRQVLSLRDNPVFQGCKTARGSIGNNEVIAVQSGPAKSRAAALTAAACLHFQPDLVVDSGTCAGLMPGADIGEVVVGELCYEYDLSGSGFPSRSLREMKLPSGFTFLDPRTRESLQRAAVSEGRRSGLPVRIGAIACGEFLVQSLELRDRLYDLFHAVAADWETAAVFVAALRSSLPPLSIRIVSDLGNEEALRDFRRHVKPQSRVLYGYIGLLLETGWFGRFQTGWRELDTEVREGLSAQVLP
jgi:adenosylhomocysteine nucleosidase